MKARLYFTVDVDRDVNIPMKGTSVAGSMDRGSGSAPRFSSSERGIRILADMLDDIGVKGTFFVEGRTAETVDCSCLSRHAVGLHGYDHEDLSGMETGMVPDVEGVLRRGYDAVSDNVARPTSFRAPYMLAYGRVMEAIKGLGIRADSSFYTEVGASCDPYDLDGVTEYPVPKDRDRNGKVIAAYMWPMHEGKRIPEDYVLMSQGRDTMVLATHSWHMVETRESGVMDDAWVKANADRVRQAVEGILDLGFRAETIR